MTIKENVKKLLGELPDGVELVGAAKGRTAREIVEAIDAGVKIIGENYLQETLRVYGDVDRDVEWHFIGHLQRNKIKKAVEIFGMIDSLDSLRLAKEISKRCRRIGKVMPVLIEVNSGREEQKFGLGPEDIEGFVRKASTFPNINIMGLMTMGPRFGNPEDSRPYFKETRQIFERLKQLDLPNIEMKYLSMGMSNSYRVAIEEGANMVRIGTKIFGERR
jgi:pyridoxal phosphate enzyme (YggS family)